MVAHQETLVWNRLWADRICPAYLVSLMAACRKNLPLATSYRHITARTETQKSTSLQHVAAACICAICSTMHQMQKAVQILTLRTIPGCREMTIVQQKTKPSLRDTLKTALMPEVRYDKHTLSARHRNKDMHLES